MHLSFIPQQTPVSSGLSKTKKASAFWGFMLPRGCAPVFLYLYRRDKICKMSKMLSANVRKRALGSGCFWDAGDDGLGISCFILEGVTVLMSALFWA